MIRRETALTVAVCLLIVFSAGCVMVVSAQDDGDDDGDVDRLYVGGDGGSGTVRAIDASDGSEIWSNSNPTDRVFAVSVGPDEERVYSGDHGDAVRAYDADNGTELWSHNAGESVEDVDVSPDGETVYYVRNAWVRALHASNGTLAWENAPHGNDNIHSVEAGPDGDVVYAGALTQTSPREATLTQHDAEDGSVQYSRVIHDDYIYALEVTEDGDTLYSASADGSVQANDASDGSQIWSFGGHTGIVRDVRIGPDGEYVYSVGYDHAMRRIDASDGTQSWNASLSNEGETAATDINGVTVWAGASNGNVTSHDAADGSINWEEDVGSHIRDMAGSPEPSPLVSDLEVEVRDLLLHGQSYQYTVYNVTTNRTSGEEVSREDVTGSATLSTGDTEAVTIDDNASTVTATENESVNRVVQLNATYDGMETSTNVTVASPTVDNLALLPTWWKVNAVLSDWALIWIMGGTLAGVFGGRVSSAFAGVAAFFMFMVGGWLMGDVPHGVFLISLFTVLFAGMNLALNIDYTVQQ